MAVVHLEETLALDRGDVLRGQRVAEVRVVDVGKHGPFEATSLLDHRVDVALDRLSQRTATLGWNQLRDVEPLMWTSSVRN